jgi:ubiquinone/menaquinone biosynthesis C-methylase UbiE
VIDSDKLRNWYDFQAPLYHLWRDDYDGPLVRAAVGALGPGGPPSRILDAGCGTGLFSIGLARCFDASRIEGLDVSAGMIRVAGRQARRLGLRNAVFRQGDVTDPPYPDGSFDAVVAAGLLPNLNDWSAALAQFHRVLQPEGQLLVIEFDRSSLGVGGRAFFRSMILGYKVTSSVFRRFRFADRWNIRVSTVERATLERHLREAGFRQHGFDRRHGHLIYLLVKGSRPAHEPRPATGSRG